MVIIERIGDPEFQKKKTVFFQRLALNNDLRKVWKLHKKQGQLWDKADSWRNVSKHCLREVASVTVLADWLGLSGEMRKDLRTAAAAHDFSKRIERSVPSAGKEGGMTWDDYQRDVVDIGVQIMKNEGFSDRVIGLSDSVAHADFERMNTILEKDKSNLTEEDIARLIMHYVDDVTVNAEWAEAAREVEGETRNSLDDRTLKNARNPKLTNINQEGVQIFGVTTYELQRSLGHKIESRLAELINDRKGSVKIENPLDLPIYIDNEIIKLIEETNP